MVRYLFQLTPDPSGAGIDGLEALLGAAGRPYLPADHKAAWVQVADDWGKMLEIPTHLLWWPGQESDPVITLAQERGIECQPVAEFLHRLWQNEKVFALPKPYAVLNGRPLLWHLLQAGGFEPSLIWPGEDNTWIGIQGSGQCSVVPEAWLDAAGASSLGQSVRAIEGYWETGEDKLAFYRSQFRFLGFLERWPQPALEHTACTQIIQAFEYGVAWTDIQHALKSWGVELKRARWDLDDMGPGAGAAGEELPASPAYDLEDRRAG